MPTQSTAGTFWDDRRVYEINTSRPVLLGQSAQRSISGLESLNSTTTFEFDIHDSFGFGGAGAGDTLLLEIFTRDEGGRPISMLRRFQDSNNGIDVHFSGGDIISTYMYRPDGRIAQLVNLDGTHDFTYNTRGLLRTQVVSGEGTYTYGYDVMGRPNSLTYPDSHTRMQFYDSLGRITLRCYGYSASTTRCYTAQYDPVGNPTRMGDPEGIDVFEYDTLDRLKKVTRQVGSVTVAVEDYDYNALGALKLNAGVALAHQRPRLDGIGNADAAVPATADGQTVTLDAGGRVTSLHGVTLVWSREGFLRQAQDPIPALTESYAVDSELRRVAKIQGAASEYYVYEGLDRVATVAATGAVLEQYIFDGIDHPLRIKQGDTTAYYEIDLAGNVRALRASGGASLGAYRYSAFGQMLEDTTSITQPLRWKGRWFSTVAGGIYDVRARQWSPELAVFLSVDEFSWHHPSTTLWGWPRQNPVREADPLGRGWLDVIACIWNGGSVAECSADEGERLDDACRRSPNACRALGGVPGRGGPFSNDESSIRKACSEAARIAYEACLNLHALDLFPSWTCRGVLASAELECLRRAGLQPLPAPGSGGLPCWPALPVPVLIP
jgi:RHS repeat-associated protein